MKRHAIHDRISTAIWVLSASADPRARVVRTLQLIDTRLALSRLARPSGMTFSRWIKRLPDLSTETPHLNDFLRLVELAAYGTKESFSSIERQHIVDCCTAILREISLAKCQKSAEQLRAREKSTLLEADRSANFPVSPDETLPTGTGSNLVSVS
jgi:hypothetical protein